ncbi:MAG: YfiR family protein, partial [Limisphaerales bacterium]
VDEFVTTGGGMVRFLIDQNKVNLRINLDTAKAAGLVLDSRLLRMAEIVRSE